MEIDPPYLSVVIPAYNESANLQAGALEQVADYLEQQDLPFEVLVVDDGSLDNTAGLVEAFNQKHSGFHLIRAPHGGKARAVMTGLEAARGEIVLFSDMDQATPIQQVTRLLPWFDQGYSVVIGSRGTVRRNAPIWRKLMSASQVLLRNLLLGFRQVHDTQCGFKAFRREAIHPILSRMVLYGAQATDSLRGPAVTSGFDVELLFVAQKLGYSIREVPVEWDYKRSRRVNLLRDALRGIRDLVRIRAADWQGAYRSPSK